MAKSRKGKRKAPIFAVRDEIKIKAKRDNGGVSEKTKQRRNGVEKTFNEAQTLNERPSLKDLCESRDKDGLESDLQGFFQSFYCSPHHLDCLMFSIMVGLLHLILNRC